MKISRLIIALAIAIAPLPAIAANDADVTVENAKTYAKTCSEAHFQGRHGTFRALALSNEAGECEFLTLKEVFPGVLADKAIMTHYLELDGLTSDKLDIELKKEPDDMMQAMFGIRNIVDDIYMTEMADHCTYIGGHNETSTAFCK